MTKFHDFEPIVLRKKAIKILKKRPKRLGNTINEADALKLYHELAVNQIELELQNEELLQAQEKANALAKEKYIELFDFAPSGFLTLSREAKIIDLNLCASRMLGLERVYLKYRRFNLFVSNDTRPVFNRFLERVFNSKRKETCEVQLIVNSYLTMDVQLNGIVADNGDGCLVTMVDISELKKKTAELLRLNSDKDKLFSIISHDLKGPLSAFIGTTELIAERLHQMKYDDILDFTFLLKNSANSLFRLLENLLEWSSMQRGLIKYDPKPVLLLQRISERNEIALQAAAVKNITMTFDIAEDLTVCADDYMLDSIIRNLLSNAVKFTPRGGCITVSAKSMPYNSVKISIKDTGIGMDHKIIDNLFNLTSSSKRKGTEGELSTGLGLIICKDFIEKHSRKLQVESEEGKGSDFHFTLPQTCTDLTVSDSEKEIIF